MKSYIKIYGPPIVKAVKALETVAVDMPEVCIMSTEFALGPPIMGIPMIKLLWWPWRHLRRAMRDHHQQVR